MLNVEHWKTVATEKSTFRPDKKKKKKRIKTQFKWIRKKINKYNLQNGVIWARNKSKRRYNILIYKSKLGKKKIITKAHLLLIHTALIIVNR